jgi:hypothetical protein
VSRVVRIAPRAPVPCEIAPAAGSVAGTVQEPERTIRPAALTRRRALLGLVALLVLVVAIVVVRDLRN